MASGSRSPGRQVGFIQLLSGYIEIGEWETPSVTVTQMVVARVQRVLALFRGAMALVEIDTTYSM